MITALLVFFVVMPSLMTILVLANIYIACKKSGHSFRNYMKTVTKF